MRTQCPFAAFLLSILLPLCLNSCGLQHHPSVNWKLQAQSPADNPDFRALVKLCEKIQTISGDRFTITPYPAGMIAGGDSIFDAVEEGNIQMGMGWPNWWLGKDQAWNMVQSGPFEFMTIAESMMYFFEDEGTELANELANPHGILWRPAWWTGMEFGIMTTFPAKGLDDLRGKNIRMGPGMPQELLKDSAGCNTIPTVPEEIFDALKSGALDGVEWTVPSATWDMKFHEICKTVIVPAVWQPAVLGDFLINMKSYNDLPEEYRLILETAIKDFAITTTIKGKMLDLAAMEKYRKHGVQIIKWSDNDLQRMRKSAEKIYSRHCAENLAFKKIYNSKMKFKERFSVYMSTHGPYDLNFPSMKTIR